MDTTALEESVARGARWLDRKDPSWCMKIESVFTYSDDDCPLGQVFGSFDKVIQRIFLLPANTRWDNVWPTIPLMLLWGRRHGFVLPRYAGLALDQEWRAAWNRETKRRKTRVLRPLQDEESLAISA